MIDTTAYVPVQIVIEIVPLETGCERTLTHEILPDIAQYADQVKAGWPVKLDALADSLA